MAALRAARNRLEPKPKPKYKGIIVLKKFWEKYEVILLFYGYFIENVKQVINRQQASCDHRLKILLPPIKKKLSRCFISTIEKKIPPIENSINS